MDDGTVPFDEVGTGKEMSIWVGAGLTLEEVRRAAETGEDLYLVIAQVGNGREQIRTMPLRKVRDIEELPGGFRLTGSVKQPLFMTLTSADSGDVTLRYQMRESVCKVIVQYGQMSVSFVTTISTSDVTGMFNYVDAALAFAPQYHQNAR